MKHIFCNIGFKLLIMVVVDAIELEAKNGSGMAYIKICCPIPPNVQLADHHNL